MRAFVLTGPRRFEVQDVPAPGAGPGEVVVDLERVGLCGTDVEFWTGEMAYLHQGHSSYPIRLGHEWCGRVVALGPGVDPTWLDRRVMGDTMLGDGTCRSCRRGRQHVCAQRQEVGIRGGRDGALAERIAVPATSLHALPDSVDPVLGALVEPGGNAWRAVRAARVGPGDRVLVLGAGTIGALCALFLRAAGVEVHLLDRSPRSLAFISGMGFEHTWTESSLPDLPFDAVIDCSTGAELPARAVDLVEPGGRVVCIGLAGTPSRIDTRALVLKDVTVVGILSASPGLAATIEAYATGLVDPRPLVATTVGLDRVGDVLAGTRLPGAGNGPKVHIDPQLR